MSQFNDNPSHQYLRAVAQMEELLLQEGLDNVERAFAEVARLPRVNAIRAKGLALSDRPPLVEELLGVDTTGIQYGPKPPYADHSTLWNKDGQPAMYVSEPYSLDGDTLALILGVCNHLGLELVISAGAATWFPSHTLALMIRKQTLSGLKIIPSKEVPDAD